MVEKELGGPTYRYTQWPPKFGKSMITEKEIKEGFVIHVYLIRKFPPYFLVVKVPPNSKAIVEADIETS